MGSIVVQPVTGGGATAVIKVRGLTPDARWTVDINGGSGAKPNEHLEIAFKSGVATLDRTRETVTIQLTKSEFAAFQHALSTIGVVVRVTDGQKVSVADIPASTTK